MEKEGSVYNDFMDVLRSEVKKFEVLEVDYCEFITKMPGYLIAVTKNSSPRLLRVLKYEYLTDEEMEEFDFNKFRYRKKYFYKVPLAVVEERKRITIIRKKAH